MRATLPACMLDTQQARPPLQLRPRKASVCVGQDPPGCQGPSPLDLTPASCPLHSPLAGLSRTPAGVILGGCWPLASLDFYSEGNLTVRPIDWCLSVVTLPPQRDANAITQVCPATKNLHGFFSPVSTLCKPITRNHSRSVNFQWFQIFTTNWGSYQGFQIYNTRQH